MSIGVRQLAKKQDALRRARAILKAQAQSMSAGRLNAAIAEAERAEPRTAAVAAIPHPSHREGPLYTAPPAPSIPPGYVQLERARDAYKWGYEYLQDRMRSIGRNGWAQDCDGEIEYRIAAKVQQP